ncbi:hypothetical protein B0H13DRAFT_1912558 [Mycena leptocephala]|nr:hypothetical protein B0H13DRAFT_1912558 [Mycena leptocephala]
MPPTKKAQCDAATRARAKRHPQKPLAQPTAVVLPDLVQEELALSDALLALSEPTDDHTVLEIQILHASDAEPLLYDFANDSGREFGYEGGVNIDESNGEYQPDSEHESNFTDSDLSEFDEEIIEALKKEFEALSKQNPFFELSHSKSKKDWSKEEANRSLGYNGLSERTGYRRAAQARDRNEQREVAKTS